MEQSFIDYELLVIDGGSSDKSLEVIREHQDVITSWTSEPDGGIYCAMNKGIRKSRGEYCYFLNSGDYLADRDVLKEIFKTDGGESILIGNIVMVTDRVVRVERYPRVTFGLFYTGSICHQASFIRRKLFDRYGLYDEQLKVVSDWKFFLETIVLNNESVRYLDINVAYHDLFGVSITETRLFSQERREVLRKLFPPAVLSDYDKHWSDVKKMDRLKRHKVTSLVVSLGDRLMDRFEREAANNDAERLCSAHSARISKLSCDGWMEAYENDDDRLETER